MDTIWIRYVPVLTLIHTHTEHNHTCGELEEIEMRGPPRNAGGGGVENTGGADSESVILLVPPRAHPSVSNCLPLGGGE